MPSPVYGSLDTVSGVTCVLAGVITTVVVVAKLCQGPNLDAIPTVGPSSWLGSLWAGYKFEKDAMAVIQEGYDKYKTTPFKVADRYRWIVVLRSRGHMDELRKAVEESLSFQEAANDRVKMKYTMGPELLHNQYHFDFIRSRLNGSLTSVYDDMRDEIVAAFEDVLGLRDHEWKSVPAQRTIQKVVCRTSNRIFVGLPLCRDADWVDLNVQHTLDVVKGSNMIKRFPGFLEPIVAHYMTNVPGSVKRGMKLIAPAMEERLRLLEAECGKGWPDKRNDLLSWLLEEAPEGPERSLRLLTVRLLSANFAAVHTSSNSLVQALFFLAESPQYIQPLREEVESIVQKEGWSKASLAKMRKIDSFLKESQRMAGIVAVSLQRMAMKDYTFQDGTFIPKGTYIVAPSRAIHHDDEYYPNPYVFDPFRFSNTPEREGTQYQYVSTSLEYLPFGHGRHACPGRFFAASELKSMLAHIVVSYDVKLEDNQTRPEGIRVGTTIAPDPLARVMFRNRVY